MGALLGPAEIRELAATLDVTPTKKLGQNFVHDANTVRRIVSIAGVTPESAVLEVGPGLGSLTLGLTETGAAVTAVEIDARLAAHLPTTVSAMQPDARLTVVHQDAMQVSAEDLPVAPTHLVANLPYNVSVPVLLHLLATFPSLVRSLVMVQAEVGYRLAADPGSKVYGSPSVKAAWYGSWRIAGQVSRQVFWPVPNVDSVLVGFDRHEPPGDEQLRSRVFTLVDAAFQQRRKMLRQALSGVLGGSAHASEVLEAAGIAPTARGEELGVDDFVRLGRTVLAAAGTSD
ncbi:MULTISPECIES: 16S rRNA (adenine(1518)-N(6)/adenine(1519)-N(6))-dimethyltransferase RsmA [Curtobacterium]|uniref:16S rRNA (adenine(1518)-N(6)/adenine(1519)-N(6))- dimethyltransferase RsmA n=1 Tax=Curtobacterium TaxID=2034 RepID=UPI000DAA5344|nr:MULTISPECIES: 16S rRNA (adenine(1518)-N(6)/adenine(1519)-N(6))-dimethyltransferase RsmA [Curtobacterium]MBY0175324.1 16S rRNA (adenine(1518)-N(6)/adenine(1519)-N(6))-dimethyltransferase RsmA [Curtobacterium herbarum]WIE60793.1 16S rRNA (adenine(1518)-N(6)/adenine(1519)-N(6))-dimethyltransferase RsmA [Curtobacterium sp. MCLR17_032]